MAWVTTLCTSRKAFRRSFVRTSATSYTWDGRYLRKHKTPETASETIRVLKSQYERRVAA